MALGAIVGARTPAQVDGWIDAAWITLGPDDFDEIAAAIQHTRAGSGTVPYDQPLASA